MNNLKRGTVSFLATRGVIMVAAVLFWAVTSVGQQAPSPTLLTSPLTQPAQIDASSAVSSGTVPDGMWLVGTDIQPGTYRTAGPTDSMIPNCYWERLRDASGEFSAIIANGNATGPVSVTVLAGEYFSSSGCQSWDHVS